MSNQELNKNSSYSPGAERGLSAKIDGEIFTNYFRSFFGIDFENTWYTSKFCMKHTF